MPKTSRAKTGKRIPGKSRGKTMKITTRVPIRKPKPAQKATILDVVNRMLNRKTETKHIGQWVTTNQLQNGVTPFQLPYFQNVVQTVGLGGSGAPALTGQFWTPALPAMVQGISDINRIGDRLEPVSHKVKLNIRLAKQVVADQKGANATPIDLTVYVFYGFVKAMKTYQGAIAVQDNRLVVDTQSEAVTAMNSLLDKGDTTFVTFDGSQEYSQLPLGKYVDMKVKKIHLRQAAGWINTGAGNNAAVPNTDSQNTIRKEVTLKFKPKAKLTYASATDIYPNNYAPVFALGYVYNDATASTNQLSPSYGAGTVEYTAFSSLYFKDHQ